MLRGSFSSGHGVPFHVAATKLAASYATVNRTTAIPAVYVPPSAAMDPENRERWAKTLETRGGMGEIHQDIKGCERSFEADRENTRAAAQRERRDMKKDGPDHGGPGGNDDPGGGGPGGGPPGGGSPAGGGPGGKGGSGGDGPAEKPMQVGGDPSVGAAPPRSTGPAPTAPARQPAKDKDAPAKPTTPTH